MKITVMTQAEVADQIELISTTAKTLQADIHLCAVSTLDHIREHGDTRGAANLLNALPNGQRVKGLVAWFEFHSSKKAKFVQDKSSKLWSCNLQKDRSDEDFLMDAAEAIDFGSFTAEATPVTLTLVKFIKKLESTASNTEKNANGTDKVDESTRAFAAELVNFARAKLTKPAAEAA